MQQEYSIRALSEAEFKPLFAVHRDAAFDDTHGYAFQDALSHTEKEQLHALGQALGAPYKLYLGVFDAEDRFVGWSWGFQENASTYYMVNSAILAQHRRKGLYGLLLAHCITVLSDKGFQLIYSRHCATNNAVIIPKLKAGFIISKMEIDDRFGVLIHLHYYTNPARRKVMDYRCGQLKPDAHIKTLMKI